MALTGCSLWYLLRCGFRPGKYEAALLILAAVIFAGFARSSDSGIKMEMLLMALFAVNLGFCRMAGGFVCLSAGHDGHLGTIP